MPVTHRGSRLPLVIAIAAAGCRAGSPRPAACPSAASPSAAAPSEDGQQDAVVKIVELLGGAMPNEDGQELSAEEVADRSTALRLLTVS